MNTSDGLKELMPSSLRLRKNVATALATGERELWYVPVLCDPDRVALDIGAARGVYSFVMRQNSKAVVSIEPHPYFAALLRARFSPQKGVAVVQAAASDHNGKAILRVPRTEIPAGTGTIEAANRLDQMKFEQHDVPLVVLGSLIAPPVGFIKIDVEGHELAVLRGSIPILERDCPNLLIEAEDRHRSGAVSSLVTFLQPYGYEGFFLVADGLMPVRFFCNSRHQVWPNKPYINNFIFVQRQNIPFLTDFNSRLGSSVRNLIWAGRTLALGLPRFHGEFRSWIDCGFSEK
jgi:FkbM family methyltransferase